MSTEAAKAALDAYLDEHRDAPLAELMAALTPAYSLAELSQVFTDALLARDLVLTLDRRVQSAPRSPR